MTRLPFPIAQDAALSAVLDAVEAEGHRAYLVGGAVRNALIGQPVDDIDIATNALPDTVIRLARRAGLKPVPTGIEHGTVTVVAAGRGFEVTSFRRDVATDGRRAVVAFTEDLAQDALRRDFTINALYADRDNHILDPVGGLDDLAARKLRFVGDASQRIREDYLRILRLFRFLACYGSHVDPAAIEACAALKSGLAQISRERIGAELRKLLAACDPTGSVRIMAQHGILQQILPGSDTEALAALTALEHAVSAAPDWQLRLAALNQATGVSERLKLSRREVQYQGTLRRALTANWSLAEAAYRHGERVARGYALLSAAGGSPLPGDWSDQIAQAAAARLPISAQDLIPGLQGAALGEGLRAAEDLWLSSGFTASKDKLISAAQNRKDQA